MLSCDVLNSPLKLLIVPWLSWIAILVGLLVVKTINIPLHPL